MKGFAKKLLTLGLGAVLAGSCLGFAGCKEHREYDYSSNNEKTVVTLQKNVYIVINENDVCTLHKGNVCYEKDNGSYNTAPYTILRFNCGKEIGSTTFNFYPQTRPDTSKYDEVCECSHEWISENN